MGFLPDVILLGQLPLDLGVLTGLLGGVAAYLLAGWIARREGAPPAGAQDLVLNLLIGGYLGAKLLYVVIDPAAYLGNPALLLLMPQGQLALPAGVGGALLTAAWGLRRQSDRMAVLDQAAPGLAVGVALTAIGLRGPGSWAFAPLLGLAALGALATAWRKGQPGERTVSALVLVPTALVLADIARPAAGAFYGISWLQLTAATLGTCAWLWARRRYAP